MYHREVQVNGPRDKAERSPSGLGRQGACARIPPTHRLNLSGLAPKPEHATIWALGFDERQGGQARESVGVGVGVGGRVAEKARPHEGVYRAWSVKCPARCVIKHRQELRPVLRLRLPSRDAVLRPPSRGGGGHNARARG